MTGPPAHKLPLRTVSRGSRQKQPRAFDGRRRVRVIGENGILIDTCTPESAGLYLSAPNAQVKKAKDGSIKYILLLESGDDRGHAGERHGSSTITTERVRNDWGELIGGDRKLQHKRSCTSWGAPVARVKFEDANDQH